MTGNYPIYQHHLDFAPQVYKPKACGIEGFTIDGYSIDCPDSFWQNIVLTSMLLHYHHNQRIRTDEVGFSVVRHLAAHDVEYRMGRMDFREEYIETDGFVGLNAAITGYLTWLVKKGYIVDVTNQTEDSPDDDMYYFAITQKLKDAVSY